MKNTNKISILNLEKPVLIAGPCSAETEIQVMQTAKQIAERFPNAIFRAGVWH